MLRLFIHSPKVVHSILFPVKEKKKNTQKVFSHTDRAKQKYKSRIINCCE